MRLVAPSPANSCLVYSRYLQWLHCPVGSQDPAFPHRSPKAVIIHIHVPECVLTAQMCHTCTCVSCSQGSHILMHVYPPSTSASVYLNHTPHHCHTLHANTSAVKQSSIFHTGDSRTPVNGMMLQDTAYKHQLHVYTSAVSKLKAG